MWRWGRWARRSRERARPRGRVRLRHRRRAAGQARRRRDRRRGDPVGAGDRQAGAGRCAGARLAPRRGHGPSSRVCVRAGAPMPDFATPEAFRRMLEDCQRYRLQRPGGRRLGRRPSGEAVRAGRPCRHDQGQGLPQQTGVEVARRVVEGKADFGLTLSGEVASVEGAVDRRPAAAAVRPGHDLLRGGDGGERRDGGGCRFHRRADQTGQQTGVDQRGFRDGGGLSSRSSCGLGHN